MIHTIENEYLLVSVVNIGATLQKLIDKKTGLDLVIGYTTEEEYLTGQGNIGASIGRNANRIGKARFSLNGKEYLLSENDHGNQLHGGGVNGFAFKNWQLTNKSDDELVFEYFSKDLEEGFPGNLKVKVTYKLDKNNLLVSFEGESDQDTIFNMTNHSYFNLGGKDILEDELKVHTDKYSPTDEVGLSKDEVKDVKDTGFDFREFRKIKDNLAKLTNGIDNNYVWEEMGDKLLCEYRNDKIQLNVYSDMPDMHIYTANFLNDMHGKNGKVSNKFGAICFEAQYYPNGINYDKYIKPILKTNETRINYIRYEVKS